jgi:nucleoside recognition membrane protein YjiH
MKILFVIGLVVIVLGILSFFIPVPHTEHHSVDAGDIHLGVNTHHDELLPPYVGLALIAVGGGLMVVGGRKRA